MAVACAAGFKAESLLFLTDVDGVRDGDGKIIPHLTIDDGERLIRDGVATGGMQAKLSAANQALRDGIAEVVIAPGAETNVVERLLAGGVLGSRLTAN